MAIYSVFNNQNIKAAYVEIDDFDEFVDKGAVIYLPSGQKIGRVEKKSDSFDVYNIKGENIGGGNITWYRNNKGVDMSKHVSTFYRSGTAHMRPAPIAGMLDWDDENILNDENILRGFTSPFTSPIIGKVITDNVEVQLQRYDGVFRYKGETDAKQISYFSKKIIAYHKIVAGPSVWVFKLL